MYLTSNKVIYLCETILFATPNYLFALKIKLFRDVDSFVCNIHFLLFILYNQMFVIVIFCSLYIIICSFYLTFCS
jgi:hypothetical protein